MDNTLDVLQKLVEEINIILEKLEDDGCQIKIENHWPSAVKNPHTKLVVHITRTY